MKKFIIFFLMLVSIHTTYSYEYLESINGNNGKILKVAFDDDYEVVVSISETGESLDSLVKKVGGIAGVNGAYFCPKDYKECNGINSSDGDRISDGKIYSKWNNTGIRYMFSFDKEGNPFIHKSPSIQPDDFEGIYNGISNFPLILKNSESELYNYGSQISEKMKAKGPKSFICHTKDKTLYMGYFHSKTIYEMVDVLKGLGCIDALNLDSGGSLAMYDNGMYKTGPGRDIMDAFVLVKKEKISEKQINKKQNIEKEIKKDILKQTVDNKQIKTTNNEQETKTTKPKDDSFKSKINYYYKKFLEFKKKVLDFLSKNRGKVFIGIIILFFIYYKIRKKFKSRKIFS